MAHPTKPSPAKDENRSALLACVTLEKPAPAVSVARDGQGQSNVVIILYDVGTTDEVVKMDGIVRDAQNPSVSYDAAAFISKLA